MRIWRLDPRYAFADAACDDDQDRKERAGLKLIWQRGHGETLQTTWNCPV